MELFEALEKLTPALDAFANAVVEHGGSATVAVEIGGHLIVRKTGRVRFDVTLRDPEDDAEADRWLQSELEGEGA